MYQKTPQSGVFCKLFCRSTFLIAYSSQRRCERCDCCSLTFRSIFLYIPSCILCFYGIEPSDEASYIPDPSLESFTLTLHECVTLICYHRYFEKSIFQCRDLSDIIHSSSFLTHCSLLGIDLFDKSLIL